MEQKQAVILAGGKGTRLAERLNGRPKPLVDIDGIPLLERQLGTLRKAGVTNVIILANHEISQIEAFCRNLHLAGLDIIVLDDGEPRGTAGALLHALHALADRFLVVYGDTLLDVDIDRLFKAHTLNDADATLFLHPNDHPFDSDLVESDEDGRIVAFHAPPHRPDDWLPNQVNAGLYVLEREAIRFWDSRKPPTDIARDLFPELLRREARMYGYLSFEYIKDIGTPKRLDLATSQLQRGVVERARRDHPQSIVFLDRDGTINELRDHIARAEDFVLIEGTEQAINQLNAAEYRVVVATNQPVIARGEASLTDVRRIHAKMATQLGKHGAYIDAVELCPHHPDSGFAGEIPELKVKCACRKPNTLLIDRACTAFNADRNRSWFVGDSTADMLAASRAGIRSILVATGLGGLDGKYVVRPDYSAQNLSSAVDFILYGHQRLKSLVEPIAHDLSPGHVVLVGGLAKQGKSSLSSALREALRARGLSSDILSLDGYLLDLDFRKPGVLGRFDLAAAKTAIACWLKGGQLDMSVPHYDRSTRTRARATTQLQLPANGILIIEGVPALFLELAGNRPIVKIFVANDEASRRERVLFDLVNRGKNLDEATGIYLNRQDDEARTILQTRDRSDIRISLDDVYSEKPRAKSV
jgi:histidinol-phosphate phosphatase family protein